MQVKVVKKTENELTIEVEGEGHTLFNLLESVLLEDEEVEFAGYKMPHPLIPNTVVTVRTRKGKTPEEAIKDACEKILQRGKELNAAFTETLQQKTKNEP